MISQDAEKHWKSEIINAKKEAEFALATKINQKINDAKLYIMRESPDIYNVSRLLNEISELLKTKI